MIRIDRATCPACLTNAPSTGDTYRKQEVVTALWQMQHKKCCYSEVLIPEKGHGKAVEHFHPKSRFAWLRNQWINLLLACPQCNGRKSDRFPELLTDNDDEAMVVFATPTPLGTPAIIDPSDPAMNPEEHLTYVVDYSEELSGQVIPRANSEMGEQTIAVTGIDDEFFYRSRKHHLDGLVKAHLNIIRARTDQSDLHLQIALDTFAQCMDARAPFAGLARQYARVKGLDKRFGLAIPGPAINE